MVTLTPPAHKRTLRTPLGVTFYNMIYRKTKIDPKVKTTAIKQLFRILTDKTCLNFPSISSFSQFFLCSFEKI